MSRGGRPAPDLTFGFEPDPTAPARARAEMFAMLVLLEPHGGISDTAVLVVSELVSNVVLHAECGGVMRAWIDGPTGRCRIEVEDQSSEIPEASATREIGGLGLQLVDRLSDEWGVDSLPDGKIVWAEIEAHALPC